MDGVQTLKQMPEKLAPNGPLPATLPEANRAEGNVGERCAAAARTPSPTDTM